MTQKSALKIMKKIIKKLKGKPKIPGITKFRPMCFDKKKGIETQKQKLDVTTNYYNEFTQAYINNISCKIMGSISPVLEYTMKEVTQFKIIKDHFDVSGEMADSEAGKRAMGLAMAQSEHLDALEVELGELLKMYEVLLANYECFIRKSISFSLMRFETYRRFAHAGVEDMANEFKNANSPAMNVFLTEIEKVIAEIKYYVEEGANNENA